ncbi:DUF382 domain-containing protein [Chloropicon primus]|uniref:DUF382 domain-containing protein n=1 Tax=Chloropicon primus TaxID=1764295 RepID=A0A5B8MCW6_9CHLO|nr:DUF382 domain-containing protein [Chloropicon primus]|eukprot:QDZ18279.1 DUF382 domain-containing protein [Chloropicon primus]
MARRRTAEKRRARKERKRVSALALRLKRASASSALARARDGEDVEVVYEAEQVLPGTDEAFREVWERFYGGEEEEAAAEDNGDGDVKEPTYSSPAAPSHADDDGDDDDVDDDDDDDDDHQHNNNNKNNIKNKKKKKKKFPLSQLKQVCPRPEVVEGWDADAKDPELLVLLKSCRNTVPVPSHWSHKRHYLQGKRGIEKPPFRLPAFISATGIEGMRQTGGFQEDSEETKLKTQGRERMNPKMGKIEIDYQVLHDAFFKHQTKPKLSEFGEVYYEGKEYEAELKEKRPGMPLSREVRVALGMARAPQGLGGMAEAAGGPEEGVVPPPWLINMQRYGPPPSYPHLVIPGLNAPIPRGASFGYHPGGWGKPPVDEFGNPLYGDVFGTRSGGRFRGRGGALEKDGDVSTSVDFAWGAMESEEESESEYEEVENPEDLEDDDDDDVVVGMEEDDMVTGDDQAAQEEDLEEDPAKPPEAINLRKDDGKSEELYTVLEEAKKSVGEGELMGSDKVYVVGGKVGLTGAAAEKNPQQQQDKEKKKKKKEKEFKF